MLSQYKYHIWSLKEYSHDAIVHATPTQLKRLDKVQNWYLHELGLYDAEAFVKWNFAPPSLRRIINLLGFLHKRILNKCHPATATALPLAGPDILGDFHASTLDPCCHGVRCNQRLHSRSLYAFIHIYNRLPQVWIDAQNISAFQKHLTQFVKMKALANYANWRSAFQDMATTVHMLYGRCILR